MSDLRQLIESEIKKKLSKDETHPYHAHVNVDGNDEDFITGYGKTKEDSKDMAVATNRVIATDGNAKAYEGHWKLDKDDEDDVHAHELHKTDAKFRVSKKAHDYIHDTHGDLHPYRGRDGYEMTHESMPKLHFDWKKKTISHKDEM